MNSKTKKQTLNILMALSACIIILAYSIYALSVERRVQVYNGTSRYDFSPSSNLSEPSIITLDIKEESYKSISLMSIHQEILVYENGNLIYTYEKNSPNYLGKSAAVSWHIIPVGNGDTNIRIEFYAAYESLNDYENTIMVGQADDIIEMIILKSAPSIIVSLVIFILGVVAIVGDVYFKPPEVKNNFIYIGILLILIGVWSFNESQKIFYTLVPKAFENFVAYLALFLIPGFFVLSVLDLFSLKSQKILKKISFIAFSNAVIMIYLQLSLTLDLFETVPSMVIIGLLGLGVILILSIKEKKDKSLKNGGKYLSYFLIIGFLLILEAIAFFNKDFESTAFFVRLTLVIFVVLVFLRFFNNVMKNTKDLTMAKESLELSKINLISAKMQPHLISNTLLSIQELCYTNPSDAVDAIGDFSKYLRSNFEVVLDSPLISFEKELQFVREYITVQKICYNEEIEYIENILYKDFEVPPLSIQPLVENAIIHGIRKRDGKGVVKIESFTDSKNIIIKIIDNGVGFCVENPIKRLKKSSFSIIERFEYFLNAKFIVRSEKGKGANITIVIPIRDIEE